MVRINLSLSAVMTAVAVALMFVSLSSATSSSTEASTSEASSTVTVESTTSVSSSTDPGSTQSSVSASSSSESPTTTEPTTTMASYITCYSGSCMNESCLTNINDKCNSSMYCKIEKMSNSTSTSYYLSCAGNSCTSVSNSVYCCKTADCNRDESMLKSNGCGHPASFGMMNIIAIISTILVTRLGVCVGE